MVFSTRPGKEPKYQRVADRVRAAIQSGDLRPGQPLPTEKQLADRYRVSRPTVRAALAVLRTEGLVDSQQGRGAFVRLRPEVRRVPSPHTTEPGPTKPPERPPGTEPEELGIVEAGPVPVWGEVAKLLGVTDGEQAFVQRRLATSEEGQPQRLEATYFPILQKPAGRRAERTASVITARMPSLREALMLRVGAGVPLLAMLLAAYDADGDPIKVDETLWPADRYAIYDEQPSGRPIANGRETPPGE